MRFTTDSPNVGGTPSGVVRTKLLAPVPRSEQVLRPRLIELLDAGSDRKLTLIGAPVGYGKTTLLTQWLRSQEPNPPFAWVSLDEQDNDPVRLWSHVIEALRQGTPEEAVGADVLVGLGVVGANLIETALPLLINDLTKLPHRVVLVLDDYHLIKQKACHETVALYLVCGRKMGRVGATDRPRPWSIKKTAKKSLGLLAPYHPQRRESPNSCLGHFVPRRGEPVSARTGLQQQRKKLLDPTTTTAPLFAGVDVSKDRLDVCLRWSELERHEEEEEAFVVAYDDNGIDALLSRLLEERTVLVVLEATGG